MSDSPQTPAGPSPGLTGEEARARLGKFGPNAMPDTELAPWRMALAKFWAPVPWMLEAAILLQLALGEHVEAAVIGALLVFNAALGYFQEGRAQATLAALKSRLALNASVRRDGAWKTVPAADLVPGDTVKLSLGGVVSADLLIAATLANRGIAMAPLPWPVLGGVLAGAAAFALLVDQVKVPVLKRLRIA